MARHKITVESIRTWLEQTEQFSYGLSEDARPKQLRVNRKGDFFIIVNGELKEHTRKLHQAVNYYNSY